MTKYTHPMRDQKIFTYSPLQQGQPFLAYIGGVGKTAMHFTGGTEAEARNNADAFKADSIKTYEAAYDARMKARDVSRKKRAK